MIKTNVTTKISREDVLVAQQADPRKKLHWTRRREGASMMKSIIDRMDRLVGSICRNVFVRFCHGRDRSMDVDDVIATVKGELVLAVYRYRADGKYEPLNYLLGVTHVVLKNIHNRRNRKKRIPLNMLVSMNTPSYQSETVSTLEDFLNDSVISKNEESSLIDKIAVENLFSSINDRMIVVKTNKGSKRVCLGSIMRIILDGGTINSVVSEIKIPKYSVKKILRNEIVPILQEQR